MGERRNFWVERRISRRTALRTGAAGVGAAAAFLAACGGTSNSKKAAAPSSAAGSLATAAPKSGGLLPAAATGTPVTKQPKPGGAVSFQLPTPPPSLDPYTQTSFLCSYVNWLSYSKLFRYKAGVPEAVPNNFAQEPDLALAMPEQPDKQQFVVKLKAAKFHNGRALTSEDVRYAIDRYQNYEKSVHKPTWSFVDKLETPDPQTIVVKAKYPYADFVNIAGGNLAAYISPKEHAESADATTKMMGSGPYVLKEYVTGVSLSWTKNPDYHDKPFPYFDEVKAFITTDQAKRVADFSAKSVDLSYLFLPEERDQLKKNRPDARFEELQGTGGYIYMRTDKPPFNDKRVRQALGMAINRKAVRDAVTNGEGVYDQAVFVGFTDWALPVKDLGPAAKYWDYNPTEAKKLLEAAGQTTINTTWDHADASVYTQAYVDTATVIQAQWREVGVNAKDNMQPYAQYIGTTYQGQYEGIAHSPRSIPYYIGQVIEYYFTGSDGKRARINLAYVNNPTLNQLLDKQQGQYDVNERKATLKDIQLLLAEEQYLLYLSTDTRSYFWSPDIQNYRPSGYYPFTPVLKCWRDR